MTDIRITGRMVNFTRLTFNTNDQQKISQQLAEKLNEDSHRGTLVIIDSTVEQELISLIQLLISLGLQPFAVIDGVLGDDARAIQFPVLPPDQPLQRIKASQEDVNIINQAAKTDQNTNDSADQSIDDVQSKDSVKHIVAAHKTSYHDEILRTGQCLIQDHGDIILNASMNSGSEAIASGSIHVYGHSRGRIIAGASGAATARIFCRSLEAELVSIAGTYCVADDIPKELLKNAVHIYLNEEHELVFQALQF